MKNIRKISTGAVATMVVSVALGGCGAVSSDSGSSSSEKCDKDDLQLVMSGRGLDNEYYVAEEAGARAFAKSVGLEKNFTWIASDGDSSKQLSQIKSIVTKSGSCAVINVDPNEASLLPSLVKVVQQNGAFLVSQSNRPEGLTPQGSKGDSWVAHIEINGEPQGYAAAKELFESIGGKGNIVALQGILDNGPAKQRFAGLQRALKEYPDVKLLDDQTAEWDRTKAQNTMQAFLSKYSGKINAVWAANDGMALGALEAIKGAKLEGEVKVSGTDGLNEAIADVKDADSTGFVATTQSQANALGGFGLAIAYAAATREITPTDEPVDHRSFFLKDIPIVTSATAADVPDPSSTSDLDFSDIWSQAGEAIK